jgi:glycosyltransferase involved in cell wall biosynthesis
VKSLRIAIFDNWLKKFSQVLIDYWQSQGHTVLWEPGFNSNLVETCDRVFFESADTNAHLATQRRPHKKGKVFVRLIDVDIHANGPAGLKEGYVDGIIYIADHMKEMSEKRYKNLEGIPAKVIHMGVDLSKFTYQERSPGKNIALISTRLTPEKGFDRALMMFAELAKRSSQWQLHVVGRMFENSVWQMHIDHILDNNNIRDKVHFYGNLSYDTGNEINAFLEDKQFLLSASHKEAFSFVTAEAMSKGIKPVVYNFWGANKIWPEANLYKNEHEAVKLFESDVYHSLTYRKWIEENYPLDSHLQEMSDFMAIT